MASLSRNVATPDLTEQEYQRLLRKAGFGSDAGRRGLRIAPLEAQAITQVYIVLRPGRVAPAADARRACSAGPIATFENF